MEHNTPLQHRIKHLLQKGVDIPNPLSLDIGEDVNLDHISGDNVKIYPGCRIYGPRTVIGPHVQLGAEGPVTLDNCRLGSAVQLKGGYFKQAIFLDQANMGLGAHVREGCILEEEASAAHCVGLKQTILFPFVTLGSLINFCDCLMAGGTSRKHHSEVGSSYIHFNFTPEGHKTTASLFGDVPRGVMLNQPPIFLGGQGGSVGPLRMGFGNVVAAGAILRHDYPDNDQLIIPPAHPGLVRPYQPAGPKNLDRILRNNVHYLANLTALEHWYEQVRRPFMIRQPLGLLLFEGVLDNLALARKERLSRLAKLAEKTPEAHAPVQRLLEYFQAGASTANHHPGPMPEALATHLEQQKETPYLQAIQTLPAEAATQGTRWLNHLITRTLEHTLGTTREES